MYRGRRVLFPVASPMTEGAFRYSSPRIFYHPGSISLTPDALASRRGDRKHLLLLMVWLGRIA